ncbi:MAG: hypothetical protein ACI4W6_06245 [Acutalibacteraceae bacterium]
MSSIKLETNDLKACAQKYSSLADEFNNNCNSIINKISEYNNVWIGNFTQDLEEKVKKLKEVQKSIYSNSVQLADFINKAVDQYIKVDRGLADAATIGTADYPDNVKVSVHVKNTDELAAMEAGILADNTKACGRFNKTYAGIEKGRVNCTWYAGKKAEANGFGLSFAPGSANGADWFDRIQSTDSYNAVKYSGNNCLNDMINKEGQPITDIVLSFPYAKSENVKYCGHVLYIDQIVDGTVYYSDNGQPGNRKTCTVEELLGRYVENGSPVGCVHLKKK